MTFLLCCNVFCVTGTALEYVTEIWVQLELDVYGPHGVNQQRQDVILPLTCPPVPVLEEMTWSHCPEMAGVETLSISTHLLCHLDDPVE